MSCVHLKMEVQAADVWDDPTTWTVIIVSIVTYLLSGALYNKWMHWMMVIWAGWFTLYAFATIITYRSLIKFSVAENDNGAEKCATVTILLFVLVMLMMLVWSYLFGVDNKKNKYHWGVLSSSVSIGLLIAQLVIGYKYAKGVEDNCEYYGIGSRYLGPSLIIPMLAWISVFGFGYSLYHINHGKMTMLDGL